MTQRARAYDKDDKAQIFTILSFLDLSVFFFFYAHLSATYPTEDSPTGSFGVYEENHHLEVKILWNENIPMHACITIRFSSEFVFLLFRGFFIH